MSQHKSIKQLDSNTSEQYGHEIVAIIAVVEEVEIKF
jgi:hypothetical protein